METDCEPRPALESNYRSKKKTAVFSLVDFILFIFILNRQETSKKNS